MHLFFEFVLAYSGWRFVAARVRRDVRGAVSRASGRALGARRRAGEVRHDNLSAATHELAQTGGRALTRASPTWSTTTASSRRASSPASRTRMASSRRRNDFSSARSSRRSSCAAAATSESVEDVHGVRRTRVVETFAQGGARPTRRGARRAQAAAVQPSARVHGVSVRVAASGAPSPSPAAIYSVPSRLIGHESRLRLRPDVVEVRYATRPSRRCHGCAARRPPHRLPARDLVAGAQARRLRALSLPRGPVPVARVPAGLRRPPRTPRRPRRRRVRAHPAPRREHDGGRRRAARSSTLLERGEPFDYAAVKALAHRAEPAVPELAIGAPDLGAYDALLGGRWQSMTAATYTPASGERIARAARASSSCRRSPSELVAPVRASGPRRCAADALPSVLRARGRRAPRAPRRAPPARLEAAAGQDLRHARRAALAATAVAARLRELAHGDFVERGDNVLLFGLPGVGKTPPRLRPRPRARRRRAARVLFTPTYGSCSSCSRPSATSASPRALRALDAFDAVILDDIGYVQQSRDEMEVLFTFMAERYERTIVIITSNLVFSEWDRIFKNPMTTAAAIDRLVHHAAILEMTAAASAPRRPRRGTQPTKLKKADDES